MAGGWVNSGKGYKRRLLTCSTEIMLSTSLKGKPDSSWNDKSIFTTFFFLILVFQVLPSFHTFALNNKVKRNMDPSIGLYFIKDKFKWRIINIKIQALFKKCQCCLPFQVYLANKNWGILVPTWFCRNDQLNCFCLIPVETRTYKSTYSLSPIKLFHLLAPTVNIFLLF